MGVTYRVIRGWARLLVTTWYRTRIHGAPFPSAAPCVMVVNHTNGLVDGHFQLSVTPRPVRVLGKYKLFEIPVLGWIIRNVGGIPVYRKKDGVDTTRNADSFRAIHAALAAGDVIAVFPEGESRGTPYLRDLKTGAARMALGAEDAAAWTADVHIVPIGLSYEDPGRFRSYAEAWIGEPIAVAEWRAAYERDSIRAGRELTERMAVALRRLALQVPPGDDDGRAAAALARALERLAPPTDEPLARRRQAAFDGFERLRQRDPAGHARRVEAAMQLDANLRAHRVSAREVFAEDRASRLELLGELVLRVLAGLPFAALCAVVWGPPALLGHVIAVRGASTPDKVTTVTMLVTFGALLLYIPLLLTVVAQAYPGRVWEAAGLAAVGLAALTRTFDNFAAARRLVGRARLIGDPAARARLAETLTKLRAALDSA